MRTAGHWAGNEHTHLPSGMAVTVTTAVMPAVALLVPVTVRREAIGGHRGRGGGDGNMAAV